MVDARDEGELGVSASVRREGGGGKDHPGFYSLEEDFMEHGKDFMEGSLGSQPESLVISVPFGVRSWNSCCMSSCRHTPSRDSGSGKVLGHCGTEGLAGAEYSWPAEHLFSA